MGYTSPVFLSRSSFYLGGRDKVHDVGEIGSNSNAEITETGARVSKVNRATNTIRSDLNASHKPELDGDGLVLLSISNQGLDTGLVGGHKFDNIGLEGHGGGASARDRVGQSVAELKEAQGVEIVGNTIDKGIVVLAGGLVLQHLDGVAVVGRLEGGSHIDETVGAGGREDFEGPVLVRGLGHARADKVHGHHEVGADSSQTSVKSSVGGGAREAGEDQGTIGSVQAVDKGVGGVFGGVQGGGRQDIVVARLEAQVLDGRDTNVFASGGSAEGDISELEGQLGGVLDVDDGGHDDSVCGVQVEVNQKDVLEVQVVQSSKRSGGLEANAGDGQVAKDAQVQLDIDGALQGDGVRGLGGQGTDEAREGSMRGGEDVQDRGRESGGQSTTLDVGSAPWCVNVTNLHSIVLVMKDKKLLIPNINVR